MAKKNGKELGSQVPTLPDGCYTDENELWHLPDGRLLADGLYRNCLLYTSPSPRD